MDTTEVRAVLLDVAREMAARGPGYAQQSAVLSEAKKRIPNSSDLRVQQLILTCWHDLFLKGDLSWGYNLDNRDAPFYHLPAGGLPASLESIPSA